MRIGTHIARVHAIFQIPPEIHEGKLGSFPLPPYVPRTPLAYVRWFKTEPTTPRERKSHRMIAVTKESLESGKPCYSIIPLSNIRQSCMLIPYFEVNNVRGAWVSDSILNTVNTFVINNWQSLYTYRTIY